MNKDSIPGSMHEGNSLKMEAIGVGACTLAIKSQSGQRSFAQSMMASNLNGQSSFFDVDDVKNPRNWAARKKVAIAIFVIVAGFVA